MPKITQSLGINVRVCSWICVAAWIILTMTPTARPARSIGRAEGKFNRTAHKTDNKFWTHMITLEKKTVYKGANN